MNPAASNRCKRVVIAPVVISADSARSLGFVPAGSARRRRVLSTSKSAKVSPSG
jgi:hypothetical protein